MKTGKNFSSFENQVYGLVIFLKEMYGCAQSRVWKQFPTFEGRQSCERFHNALNTLDE